MLAGMVGVLALPSGAGALTFTGPSHPALGFDVSELRSPDFDQDGRNDLLVVRRNESNAATIDFQVAGPGGSFSLAGSQSYSSAGPPVLGDFNHDGDPDFAFVVASGVDVVLGSSGATFGAATTYAAPVGLLVVGDFDGDGNEDLAVADYNSGNVSILLGTGTGGFLPAASFPIGSFPSMMAAGDFNEDGRSDLAVSHQDASTGGSSSTFEVHLAGPGGAIGSTASTFTVGSIPRMITVSDFNGDGDPDVAVPCFSSDAVSIVQGAAGATFAPTISQPVGDGPAAIVVGDFNGDDDPDVAVTNGNQSGDAEQGDVSVLTGGTGSSFTAGPTRNTYDMGGVFGLTAGDYTGDGDQDLAVLATGGHFPTFSIVSILVGDAGSSFRDFIQLQPFPADVLAADFNGDGDLDVAFANQDGFSTSVALGGPGGSHGNVATYDVGPHALEISTADFNADNDPDLLLPVSGAPRIGLLLGSTGGTFGPVTGPFLSGAIGAAVADFNADGKPDAAVTANSGVQILLGTGGGNFGSPTTFPAGTQPNYVASADFNGDNDPDLAIADTSSNSVSILIGGAGGSFGAPTTVPVGSSPQFVGIADFNADSDPDLVTANNGSSSISVALGGAGGSFGAATAYAVGLQPFRVAAGDLNGDGDPDLAVANRGSNFFSILLGGAGGTFGAATSFDVGNPQSAIGIADFNRDGLRDIVVAYPGNSLGSAWVLLNEPPGAGTGHPRPKGATPLQASLVPAFTNCLAPNRAHGAPLAFGSCSPPEQVSPYLTVGTPDANSAAANSVGLVNVKVLAGAPGPPDDSDVAVHMQLSDVRCQTGAAACANPNAVGGADYAGDVRVNLKLRITDAFNGSGGGGGTDSATVEDTFLSFTAPCSPTPSTSTGSTCAVDATTSGTIGRLAPDGRRVVLALGQVKVLDGGPDGSASTTSGDKVFAVQGVFVP